MFSKYLLKKLNKRYAGKELMFCEKLYTDLMFLPDNIRTCCFCTKMPYNPPVLFKKTIKRFRKISYIFNILRIMKINQSENAVCKGCKFFKKQYVPRFDFEKNLKFITLNHFTDCNSNCVYCIHGNIVNKLKKKPYKILPVMKQLFEKNMINPYCLINWGGGEPTIYSEFISLVKFFREHKIRQAVNSSGIVFIEEILEGMKDSSVSIQISPDAGCKETYRKIKRQNNFDAVWDNIKKYSLYPDMLFVKYVFFSFNANENDVRLFIDKCVSSGVKNIVIDCESESANNPEGKFGNITDEIVKLALLMKHLAVENSLNYEISYQWKENDKKYIEEN